MLIHGKKDVRTPYKRLKLSLKAMDKNGIKYEKMIIEKETHGFQRKINRENEKLVHSLKASECLSFNN